MTPESQPSPAPRVSGTTSRARVQRRAHYRTEDDQPVLVQLGADRPDGADGDDQAFVARLADISESGLRLRLGADRSLLLGTGQEVALVVSLPTTNERLRARVVHREPADPAGDVVLGLAFLEQDRPSADRIRRHVFAVQREALARRRGGTGGRPGPGADAAW